MASKITHIQRDILQAIEYLSRVEDALRQKLGGQDDLSRRIDDLIADLQLLVGAVGDKTAVSSYEQAQSQMARESDARAEAQEGKVCL